jgi:hypothetical protein
MNPDNAMKEVRLESSPSCREVERSRYGIHGPNTDLDLHPEHLLRGSVRFKEVTRHVDDAIEYMKAKKYNRGTAASTSTKPLPVGLSFMDILGGSAVTCKGVFTCSIWNSDCELQRDAYFIYRYEPFPIHILDLYTHDIQI